jgi:hypothetical protein
VGATDSGITAPGCGGVTDDDVWYSFTAISAASTVTLSSVGANLNASGAYLEVFSGTCAAPEVLQSTQQSVQLIM